MSEMKNSGIEWIGDIPIDWQYSKMSYVCDVITDFTASGSFADLAKNVEYLDHEDYAMLVRAADLSAKREISRVYVNKHAYEYLHNSNLFGGEVILPNVGSIGDVYFFSPIYPRSTLAPNSLMLKSKFYSRYLFYLFSTNQGKEALLGLSNATTQAKFNKTQLRNMRVVVPNVQSVKRIVSYLDSKCAEIDDLVSDIQKEIQTLQEYRRSLITEAVTKGLDPNVKMKASNSQSIGLIPSTWSCMRIKNVLSGITDGTHGTYTRTEEGHPLLSAKNVFDDGLHLGENESLISEKDYQSIVGNGFPQKGDVLLCCVGTVGRCTEYVDVHPYAFQRSVIIMRPNSKIISPMLTYVMQSNTTLSQETAMINQAAQAGLYQGAVKELHIPVPPLEEQYRIVRFLDNKLDEIDYIIETKQKQLEVLSEYRKSLIYEYVTGKKEVV